MKYLVMECHTAYAVLMDEESRVVRAANLHYTVGQTVTDPVLMQEKKDTISVSGRAVKRLAAAAACLLVLSTAGFGIYSRYRKEQSRTRSVVMLVEQTRYEMKLNSNDEVICIQSDSAEGESVTDSFDGQHLQLSSAFNTILRDSLEQGKIDSETPVQIYLAVENEESYPTYKNELKQEAEKLSLNADIQDLKPADPQPAPPDPKKEHPAEQHPDPAAPKENAAPKETPKPKQDPPAAPPAPPAAVQEPAKPNETPQIQKPDTDKQKPDTDKQKPEPPVPGDTPAPLPGEPEPPGKSNEKQEPRGDAEHPHPGAELHQPEVQHPKPEPLPHILPEPAAPSLTEPLPEPLPAPEATE